MASLTSASLGRRLIANRAARWSLVVIGLLVAAAIVGPIIDPHKASEQLDVVRLKSAPPSWQTPFGTDQYSRDLLARVLQGAGISLSVAGLSVLLSMTIGTAYGLVAGYVGGRVDAIMMRVLDGFLSVPRVLLLILVLTSWSPELPGLIFLIGATGWFGVSRLVRAETMAVRNVDYVDAARALGAHGMRIVWRHLLPNVVAPVIVSATLAVGNVIALEAGLSYLGIGTHEPTASWGSIFYDGASILTQHWWIAFFPGVAIVITVLAFNTLGDALRDVLDPRQVDVSRHMDTSLTTTVHGT